MSRFMRAVAFTTVVLFFALLLTACGQSVDDAKRDVEFAKVCKDGGGRVAYNDFGGMFCLLNEERR